MAKKVRKWAVTYVVSVTREATVDAESAKEAERNFYDGNFKDECPIDIDEIVEDILAIKPISPKRKETT